MKVVMANRADEGFLDELRSSFPNVTFQPAPTAEEQMAEVKDADVVYGWPTRDAFLAADRLRWIHCPGTGIDRMTSIPELVNSDVVLTNARGPHAGPMADHVIWMMLGLAHHARGLLEDQRVHRWEPGKYSGRYVQLSGQTMGILALGDIGSAVARRALGFEMQVYAVDKRPMTPPPGVNQVWGVERLDDMLAISDWLVVTPPLTAETKGMIDRRRIGLLKQGAYVIVISRGGIVDEAALVEGLRSGRIAGAGLDVFGQEPLPADNPMWDMDNVIISPHSSAGTPEMSLERQQIFKENLRRFLDNEPFLYVCDKEAGF
jgi:phosphoglycerate dehydrogenase-like enzyme